jgi:hypothetical protein
LSITSSLRLKETIKGEPKGVGKEELNITKISREKRRGERVGGFIEGAVDRLAEI